MPVLSLANTIGPFLPGNSAAAGGIETAWRSPLSTSTTGAADSVRTRDLFMASRFPGTQRRVHQVGAVRRHCAGDSSGPSPERPGRPGRACPRPRIDFRAMADVDQHGRPEPPGRAGEVETLLGFLDYQRATLAWKTRGLDSEGLNATVGASTMTLGGLLKHLALVESDWFYSSLYGKGAESPWDAVDWKVDPNWEWRTAAEDSPEELFEIWNSAVERSRERVAEALANGGGLDQLAQGDWPDTGPPSLRWIVVHMIEEYARHNGHADLLRESVDGGPGA